jgi:hypothetical protein
MRPERRDCGVTVYVDDMCARRGPHILCHMIADTEAELHAMAERIGAEPRRYHRDHYDIPLPQRRLALAAGAREIPLRQLACMVWLRRRGHAMGRPETAELRYRRLRDGGAGAAGAAAQGLGSG